ncbi:hypothetical protein BSK59_16355 [Paenibacillus odorifer]|uniref:hypothetical protein n=1 Tax=Paenibacillus odorifer TaxID=189426 RepID=UPI00096EAED6|nr:hypothetical protein [Paenibacillus odorifer]OME54150.1 hypothetical protein BSK59_16355 [Paenibacillus odorifer]
MANYYIEEIIGSDTTGDGSSVLPYKTINKLLTVMSTTQSHNIYLGVGTYTFGMNLFVGFPNQTLNIIGKGYKTRLRQIEGLWSNAGGGLETQTVNFKKLTYDIPSNLTNHNLNNINNNWNFYNVLFDECPSNQYSVMLPIKNKISIENCIKKNNTMGFLRTDSGQIKVKNSYGAFTNGYGTSQSSWDESNNLITLTPNLDSDYNILDIVSDSIGLYAGSNSWLIVGILIHNNNEYKKFNGVSWEIVSTTDMKESDILNGNTLKEIGNIPESAWSQLTGNVELCYYTDDLSKSEVKFNIETTPFTLAEEWEDKTIKVIEYTDDPTRTESKVTLDTETFSLYDEFGDSVDILYYTDDLTKTKAELNVTANYSPIDEIEGDFELVTYHREGKSELDMTVKALPFEQFVVHQSDFKMFGDFKNIIATTIPTNKSLGNLRFTLSFDGGITWETYRYKKWKSINIASMKSIKKDALRLEELNSIPTAEISGKVKKNLSKEEIDNGVTGKFRIGYYIDERANKDEDTKLDVVKVVASSPLNDVKYNDLAFYLLNTTATINVTFAGNKLSGKLDDADKTKVRYRVLLNNQPYVPADGLFTQYAPSPMDISIVIDDRMINFDKQNTLTVEFEDSWGQRDKWETTFIGTYSGLMFMDETSKYYSDTFGGIIKYLDFGQIIAGQTTLEQLVYVKNLLGYEVENFSLEAIQPKIKDEETNEYKDVQGLTIELSKTQAPFLSSPLLHYDDVLPVDGRIEFYVRISSERTAKPIPNGKFEVRIKADKVVD